MGRRQDIPIDIAVKMVVNDDNTDDIRSDNRNISASRKRKNSDSEELNNEDRIEGEEEEVSIEEHKTEKKELSRLQKLIPTVSIKDNVTQLDIILEAIRYIDTLRDKLANRDLEMLERT